MNDVLVTYFSASGVTKRIAEKIADYLGADTFEIKPKVPYTEADLDWTDKESRSTIEMNNRSFRPEIESSVDQLDKYSTVLIGFPVWWYTAPTIINTFIESVNLENKTVIPFCTSGSTGISGSEKDLKNAYPKYTWKAGKRLTGKETKEEIETWING